MNRRRSWLLAILGAFLFTQGAMLAAQVPPTAEDNQPARSATPRQPSEFVIFNNVNDFNEFLKRLNQPDWIFMKPSGAVPALEKPVEPAPVRSHVVNGVKVRGTVGQDLADLKLDLDLGLLVPGRVWVSLGIDAQIITSAKEGDRELELKSTGPGAWSVSLEGVGQHHVVLALKKPVNGNPERRRLEMAIPEAPSTFLELDLPGSPRDLELGTDESVSMSQLPDGKGTRLSAHLEPRSRLLLEWTDDSKSGSSTAPLLAAQIEMAIDADTESVITRTSWAIRGVRGLVRRLEIRLQDQDVVTGLRLDDQYLAAGIEGNVLTIPLGEPLRPGDKRRLVLETRSQFPDDAARIHEFSGFPLLNAAEQSGAIGITQNANLWIDVKSTKGLRRIDPRELPSELRSRPGTSLAFQFLDQPFTLQMGIEDLPTAYRSEATTRLVLDGDVVRNDTTLEIQRSRGRLQEIEVEIPPGLELLSVEPPDLVESALTPFGTATAEASPPKRGRVERVRIQLTPAGRDQSTILLRLRGQQPIGLDGEVTLGLFSTPRAIAASSTVSLYAGRDVSFELLDANPSAKPNPGDGPVFRLQPRDERMKEASTTRSDRVLLAVLKSNQNASSVQGRLTHHPLSITIDNRISAKVSPRWIDVRQEANLTTRYGSVRSLIVNVPVARPDLWQVQAKELVRREEIGQSSGGNGAQRCRLVFDPPISENSSVVFRFRLPNVPSVTTAEEHPYSIPWITFDEGVARSTLLDLETSDGIQITADEKAWERTDEGAADGAFNSAPRQFRIGQTSNKPGSFLIRARKLDQLATPSVVVPRALLRTVVNRDREAWTHAWFWVETHTGQFSFTLPSQAQWIRSRIDGRVSEQVERDPATQEYRLSFPAEAASKPVLVELEYQVSLSGSGADWTPPELLGGAAILHSLWEVRVPWSEALIGVPAGWSDENEWYWDIYLWKRRPWKSLSRLVGWVSGARTPMGGLDEVVGEEQDDSHGYLFGRSGVPVALKPWIVSRAWIMAVCSGTVLLAGFWIMFSRANFRWIWSISAALGLLLVIFAHPSVLLLVIQSAFSGLVLVLLGLLIQRIIERASPAPMPSTITSTSGLSPVGVGSDDSTAIRVRTPSTMEYASPSTKLPDSNASKSSRVGRSG